MLKPARDTSPDRSSSGSGVVAQYRARNAVSQRVIGSNPRNEAVAGPRTPHPVSNRMTLSEGGPSLDSLSVFTGGDSTPTIPEEGLATDSDISADAGAGPATTSSSTDAAKSSRVKDSPVHHGKGKSSNGSGQGKKGLSRNGMRPTTPVRESSVESPKRLSPLARVNTPLTFLGALSARPGTSGGSSGLKDVHGMREAGARAVESGPSGKNGDVVVTHEVRYSPCRRFACSPPFLGRIFVCLSFSCYENVFPSMQTLEAQKLMEDVARMRAAIEAATTKPALAAVKPLGTPRKLVTTSLTSSPVTLGSSSPFTEEQRMRKEQEMAALVDEVSALESAAQDAARKVKHSPASLFVLFC